MGQKASKPAAASDPAAPSAAAVVTRQPPTNPVLQPVIKDVPGEPKAQGDTVARSIAVITPTPPHPAVISRVQPPEPAVAKSVTQHVASVPVVAKGKLKEPVAENQIASKPTVQQSTPIQKQPVQQKQQKQQTPVTAPQQKPVTSHQRKPATPQNSGAPRRPVPSKAAASPAQSSSAKPVNQTKPQQLQAGKQPQSAKPPQQKPLQQPRPTPQQKPTQQQKPANQQKPQTQPKQAGPGTQPAKQNKAKKPKQAKPSQPATASLNVKGLPKPRANAGKPDAPVAGGSLRARMSSPPKLLASGVPVNREGQGGVAATGVTAPSVASSSVTASSVSSKAGDKRRLETEDDHDTIRPINPSPQRQRKIIRRDGDTDTASAKEPDAKVALPAQPSAGPDDEKEEGEISDEEMDVPPPTSKTSLLDRLSNVHVADPITSASHATSSAVSGPDSLSARMDPALMARIDTRGIASTSNSYGQPARAPFAPHSAKQPMRNGKQNPSVNKPPFPNPISEVLPQHVLRANVADVTIKDVDQPRTKGVIGRSGNQTTVNGVAIPTGKGQGENQLDEAGQRELIEIIVELHNKGISTAELTQRGVPAQLVNRVMKALARPAPSHDPKFSASSTSNAARSTPSHRPARSDGAATSFTSTQPEAEHDADVDMDIDSENDRSPEVPWNVPSMLAPGMAQAPPMFYPSMPMMSMMHMPPFPPPFVPAVPALPPQPAPEIPAPPPPPPSSLPAPPPPPPAEPKLSLMELKAKLLANRKLKQKYSAGLDTPDASDTPTTPDFAASTPVPERSVVSGDQRPASLSTSPGVAHNLLAQSIVTSRAESPPFPPQHVGSAPPESASFSSAVSVNSRRPGAADFVDVPPSRLSSSTFFRSNVRRTFAPPQPKRLVVDLDDTSDDDSDSDGEPNSDTKMKPMSAEPQINEADALRLMHEAELQIALERKRAALLENRAKLAAYAARKKAAAAAKAANDTTSPVMLSTGVSLAPPTMNAPSVSPTISKSSLQSPELSDAIPDPPAKVSRNTDKRDKGKQKAKTNPTQTTGQQGTASGDTTRSKSAVIDLTDDMETAPTVTVPASAHFKPYQFFTPHPMTSTPSNPNTTDILDLDKLKNISLSRMMAEHRERTGKAEEDPVVCKYELRGGSCNDPSCPDFHMRKNIVASQQDLLRFIDMVLPAKKTTPPTIAAARGHLQQLVRLKPDILPQVGATEPPEADSASDPVAVAKADKIKLIKQRKATLLYQTRRLAVDQFLEEFRKTLRGLATSTDSPVS